MLLPVINIDSELCFVYKVQVLLLIAVKEQWDSEAAEWEREGMCKHAKGYMKRQFLLREQMNTARFKTDVNRKNNSRKNSEHFLI